MLGLIVAQVYPTSTRRGEASAPQPAGREGMQFIEVVVGGGAAARQQTSMRD
ncbi:MAG: hypothetical protein V4631_08790 [Pseudomonadota bacterium]